MPLAESPSWNKRQALIVIAAIAALAYICCGFVLALSGANYLLRFHRWNKFIAHMGHKLPTGRHLLYYLSGFAFTVSPAKAGEALRSVYLRGHGVSYSESVATLFAERSLDLLAMVALGCLVVADRLQYLPLVAGVLGLLIVTLTVVSRGWLPDLVDHFGGHLHQPRLCKLLASISPEYPEPIARQP